MLNLPVSVVMKLQKSKNILIMGMGGGFDVFSGLPLYFTLEKMNMKVHLASFTHSSWDAIPNHIDVIPIASGCVGVSGNLKTPSENFPEAYLSSWFRDVNLEIDAILLVDGGVDSIMVGDEEGSGTMLEDTLTLAAVKNAEVPLKLLSCVGFGTEVEENLCHYLALENMAQLAKDGGFYGSCSLVDFMDSFKQYKAACEHTWNQPGHRTSHVQTRIIPAAEGEFGDYHMFPDEKSSDVFVSPLTSIYWFYNAEAAIYYNKIIPAIESQETFFEVVQIGVPMIKNSNHRARKPIPLT